MKPYPRVDDLLRPLRRFMTETAGGFHRARARRGHFWERRYRACVVEDDPYAPAALRSLDQNPVRAGLVEDSATSPWSSRPAYALGTLSGLISLHPSYLSLSPYPRVRQCQYRTSLVASPDSRLDAREPRRATQRAVGSPAFLRPHTPARGRHRSVPMPPQFQALGG
jgi:putative transposase